MFICEVRQCIQGLPEELWGHISSFLDSQDRFTRFANVCRLFYSLAYKGNPYEQIAQTFSLYTQKNIAIITDPQASNFVSTCIDQRHQFASIVKSSLKTAKRILPEAFIGDEKTDIFSSLRQFRRYLKKFILSFYFSKKYYYQIFCFLIKSDLKYHL